MTKQIRRGLVAASVLSAVAGSAMADVTGVTTAITSAQTDGTTVVTALAAAGAAVFLIWKMLKKFGVSL